MSIDSYSKQNITGIVLAGGQGRRMGGQDKGLIKIRDNYLIHYIISALSPQVHTVFINANRNQDLYAELTGYPVFSDNFGYFEGPLAGMVNGLKIAKTKYVLFVPCDSPLLNAQLAQRLLTVLIEKNAHIAVAYDGVRIQPMFALIKKQLMESLSAFLATGQRKTNQWYAEQSCVEVDFSDIPDMFLNINSPEQFKIIDMKLK